MDKRITCLVSLVLLLAATGCAGPEESTDADPAMGQDEAVAKTHEGLAAKSGTDNGNIELSVDMAQLNAAQTTCRSGGGITVCSNGKYGCVWSDRSGKLLGCGSGI